jgi:zinc protease
MRNLIITSSLLFIFILTACDMKIEKGFVGKGTVTMKTSDPVISFNIWFGTGSVNDPEGKEGLASLTAQLMADGSTKNNKYAEILEKMYPLASGYGAKVDKEMTVFRGSTHKDNLSEFYSLFTDALLRPAFSQADFDRIKKSTLNTIKNTLRYSSDEELGKATLYGEIFAGTKYSHLTIGTVSSLEAITLDDVNKFYKENFRRENVTIGLAGDFSDKLVADLEKDLATLPKSSENKNAVKITPAKIEGLNFTLVEKENASTAISFGFPISMTRSAVDYLALDVFRSWFGEHRNQSSHLYSVIREKRGMNYGDYAYIEAFTNGGRLSMPNPNNARSSQIFEVWIRPVQHKHRHFALRAAVRELQMVVDNGLTQEAFDKTKQFLNKYCLHYAPTSAARLGYQIDSKFYGVEDGGNFIEYYRKKLSTLTLADVNAAIKKHLQYDNMNIAMISQDCESLKTMLVENTSSPIDYESPKEEEVYSEDKEIQDYKLNVDAGKIKIIPVEEMFAK